MSTLDRLAVAAVLLALALGVCAYFLFFHGVIKPPEVDTAGLDPAIGKAVAEARAMVLREPQSAQAWGHLGMVLITHDFRAPAKFCLEQAEKLDPRELRWPYVQALGAIAFGESENALPKLERAVELAEPTNDSPRLRLAELYLSLEQLDEAETHFRRLFEVSAQHAKAHLGMARILNARDDPKGSLVHLKFAQTDRRTQKAACLLLVEIHQRLGQNVEAEAQRRRAAEMADDPFWPDPINEEVIDLRQGKRHALQWARILSQHGQGARAIEVLQRAAEEYPEADEVWLQLGMVLLKYKNPQMAEAALERACELSPQSHEAVYYLGAAQVVLREFAAAQVNFRKAIKLKPDFAPAHHNLGNCLADAGDVTGAIGAYRLAVKFDPTLVESHMNLARFLAGKRSYAEALLHAQTALQLRPDDEANRKMLVRTARAFQVQLGFP